MHNAILGDSKTAYKQALPNMRMSGVIRAAGGRYGTVQVDGVGRIFGDISAAKGFRTNGVLNVEGRIVTPELHMDGKLTAEGGLTAGSVRMDGIAKIGGAISAEKLNLNGILSAGGSVEAESIDARGVMKVSGLLNAGSLALGLTHKASSIGEIGAEQVKVRLLSGSKWSWLWEWAMPLSKPRLDGCLIEGDEIMLEYTHADIVRGSRVTIGRGCKIGLVEYRDALHVHPSAEVLKEEKTNGC
ncbi:hypothetical protein [Paenibacillus soyae]|uniref:Polymer-forming cytoskeletal protein n=1 Tax=Paenibacillus soyae TaxID=2969249 RepID=A0A9X2MNZ4_9BACL|nr:hypothetical protein [Paenibacillus soyae]MCR2804176.1 hypothetical protein [Paenibacillus soyae]